MGLLLRHTNASIEATVATPADAACVSDDSDVHVCERDEATSPDTPAPDPTVTLFVTGWHNVQPGPLSWPFPSMRAALDAVRKMRNAVEWSIALGKEHASVDDARASGAILVEQR